MKHARRISLSEFKKRYEQNNDVYYIFDTDNQAARAACYEPVHISLKFDKMLLDTARKTISFFNDTGQMTLKNVLCVIAEETDYPWSVVDIRCHFANEEVTYTWVVDKKMKI